MRNSDSEKRRGKRDKARAEGRGDSLREKTPDFIVFVKYYCSDFILTIVFFLFVFCWFLPWLGFERVCVFLCWFCLFFCVFLFECNARLFF